jgi:hypothetical protein
MENVTMDRRMLIGDVADGVEGDGSYGAANNVTITGCALPAATQIVLQHCAGNGWTITGNTRAGSSADVVSQTNMSLTSSTVQA